MGREQVRPADGPRTFTVMASDYVLLLLLKATVHGPRFISLFTLPLSGDPRNDLLMAAPVGGVVFLLAGGGSG
jgi:hypothetical protein